MVKKIILDMLYPPVCMLCGTLLETRTGLCPGCRTKLRWIGQPRCMCCGRPLVLDGEEYCGDCSRRKRDFDAGIGVFPYRNVIRQAVLDLKNNGKRENAAFLGACMAASVRPLLSSWRPRCLVPIPLDRRKKRIRGYNQAFLLAKETGRCLGLPVRGDLLFRRPGRQEQKKLHRFARRRNQEGTFYVRAKAVPETVLLVDDIYTTGNTLEAAARELKRAGVKRVYFVTVCMGVDF